MVRPLVERVQAARAALDRAVTFDGAMIALSMTDNATLRELERDYYSAPAPITHLRESIARAHAHKAASKQSGTTQRVTPGKFGEWCHAALREWLPGYTDFVPADGGQYVVAFLGFDAKEAGAVYRVNTPDGQDPRHFLVRLDVQLLED